MTEPGRRVIQYSLTQLGRGFIEPLTGMCKWAKQDGKDVSAEVHLAEMKLKQGMKVVSFCESEDEKQEHTNMQYLVQMKIVPQGRPIDELV